MASETVENYLKAAYTLGQESEDGAATITRLAAVVGVTPGTATSMVKKLAAAGLAKYEKYGAVALTAKGAKTALDVLRRHRIVEQFLVEVVKLDWSEVHEEAERLEHAISPRLLDRLDEILGHPSTDPHGDPIPDPSGRIAARRLVPLSDCAPGDRIRIARVIDQDADFLRFIDTGGLRPGQAARVLERNRQADSIVVRGAHQESVTVSERVAAKILVERA